MDIRPPLRAHAEWLAQLREYVYGAGAPDVRILVRDDQCELGRWIYNDAARFRSLPEYEAARQAHATFHAEAAEVVRLMQAGRRHEAALAIERGGPLQNRSATMIRRFLWLSHRLSRAVAAGADDDDASRDADVAVQQAAEPPPASARISREPA
ncbi:MAG: CZB domain-containing protein [Rhodospirillales bacterium]|jgi:methyl-accepting chemotaxis protein|nr:CZB domain-containing protein [Rhodospirillales bacterium]